MIHSMKRLQVIIKEIEKGHIVKISRYFNIVTIFLIYTLLMFYIGWNGWVWLQTMFGWESWGYYAAVVGLLSYAYLIVQVFKFMPFLRTIGSYWFAVIQYALILLPLADIAVFILQLSVPIDTAIMWTGIVTLSMFIFIFGYGTFNAYSPVVRKYEIHIPKEARERKTLRIAMASDMHFGKLSGVSHLKRLVHHVNEMKPDIILLPGDIIDDHPGEFIKKNMGHVMKEMQAPLGVYGVLGNHEYYGRAIPEFLQEMDKIDIHIMLDEGSKLKIVFILLVEGIKQSEIVKVSKR